MTRFRALLVEDDAVARRFLRDTLAPLPLDCVEAASRAEAEALFAEQPVDLVIADLVLPDGDGVALARWIREKRSASEIIILTGQSSVETAVAAMAAGARTYLRKPVGLAELREVVGKSLEILGLRRALAERDDDGSVKRLVGESAVMRRVRDEILAVAGADVPVLLTGESGTGKELAARALHHHSGRAGAFVPVNASALAPQLVESELFGHVKGAFTGALRDHEGMFERADQGTLFLDEIGDLPLELQPKLLRVVETGEVRRLGDERSRAVNTRLVAATNRDLRQGSRDGSFRPDLYHRLAAVTIELPPLRARREDIPILADLFLRTARERLQRPGRFLDEEALAALIEYDFPGNVRELKNIVEGALLLAPGERLTRADVARRFTDDAAETSDASLAQRIQRALDETGGNRRLAAEKLGITERTLYRHLRRDENPKTQNPKAQ